MFLVFKERQKQNMNERKEPNILLVDDNVYFAKEYAETLQMQYNLKVLYATSAKEALDIVNKNPIKVAILDQVMPTKGTELFKELKKIDPNLKTVLLTAEADKHDLAEATNIGFDYALMKEDDDMEQLPMLLLLLITKYNNTNFSEKKVPFFVQESGGIFSKKQHVEYTIVGYKILDSAYVFSNSWITRNLIERGTSLSLEEEINVEKEFNFQKNFRIDSEQELGLEVENLTNFKTQLTLKMEQDFQSTYTESLKQVINRKRQFEIKEDAEGIVSRVYEYAKVFKMIKVFIQKKCSCCQGLSVDAITVYLPIPIIRYRIREYFDDGRTIELESGELRGR